VSSFAKVGVWKFFDSTSFVKLHSSAHLRSARKFLDLWGTSTSSVRSTDARMWALPWMGQSSKADSD